MKIMNLEIAIEVEDEVQNTAPELLALLAEMEECAASRGYEIHDQRIDED
ncbi:MAG: hypothetical protein ACD_16C00173G0001 [uncultured bacterium]|nr:MAG: hypothetical protein ACD_16C00173G0001 [uncultured bacterium]